MNFDDTPQEAAFRAEARQWIDANAPKQHEAELSKSSLGRIKLRNADIVEVAKAWQKKKADAGRAGDLAAGRGYLRQTHQPVPDRRGHVRADGDGLWQRGR